MIPIQQIRPSEFTYDLPQEKIALFPAAERDHSRLLIRNVHGELSEDKFINIAHYLPSGSVLYCNNSKVIPARLIFPSGNGSSIEIFCLKPLIPYDYHNALGATETCRWECMIGNARRFKDTAIKQSLTLNNQVIKLTAEKIMLRGNTAEIKFIWDNSNITFAEIISEIGRVPLPPYIKRNTVDSDRDRYQTVYSKIAGSVAAPTAGLHFTDEVLKTLREKDITWKEITLHVGAGTFQPVKADRIGDHVMHAEQFEVSSDLISELARLNNKVSCVGTTTVRTLESLYWTGAKLLQNKSAPDTLVLGQWEPYTLNEIQPSDAFYAILEWLKARNIDRAMASTSFMIVPGYHFKITGQLITNFHQPGSSLLMLIAAFIGKSWKEMYQYAMDHNFRFLSYGDSSLLFNTQVVSEH